MATPHIQHLYLYLEPSERAALQQLIAASGESGATPLRWLYFSLIDWDNGAPKAPRGKLRVTVEELSGIGAIVREARQRGEAVPDVLAIQIRALERLLIKCEAPHHRPPHDASCLPFPPKRGAPPDPKVETPVYVDEPISGLLTAPR